MITAWITGFMMLMQTGLAEPRWHNLMIRDAWERDQQERGGDGTQVPRILVYSPKNGNQTVFMGVDTAGVYRSDDGGWTWVSKMKGIEGYFIMGLAVDPGNPDRVYALADAHPLMDSPVKGLYLSEDNGENWRMVKKLNLQGMPRKITINVTAVFPDSYSEAAGRCQALLTGSGKGLFMSTDGTESFQQVGADSIGEQVITAVIIHPANHDTIYVGTPAGIYRSTDRCVSFVPYNEGLPAERDIISLGADPQDPERLYAVVGGKAVYKKEGGNPWQNITSNSGMPVLANNGTFYDIKAHPAAPNRLLLCAQRNFSTGSAFYSEDYGQTWERRDTKVIEERFNLGSRHARANNLTPSLAMTPHPSDPDAWLKAFNFGAVFKTTNACRSWVWSNNNYGGFRGMILVPSPDHPNHFIINSVDIGPVVTFDGGQSFERAEADRYHRVDSLNGVILPGASDPRAATVLTGIGEHNTTLEGVLQKSTDGGRNFKIIPGTEGRQKAAVLVHPLDSNTIYAGDVVSLDGGQSWFRIDPAEYGQIFAADPDNKDTVYLFDGLRISRSQDNGKTAQVLKELGNSSPYAKSFVNSAQLNSKGDKIYIGHDGGIYIYDIPSGSLEFKTEQHGLIRDPSGRLDMKSILIDPKDDQVIYAGEFSLVGGNATWVFKSSDGGQSWQSMMTDDVLGNRRVWGMGMDRRGILWVFTDHGPFWYGDVSVPGGVHGLKTVGGGNAAIQWDAEPQAFTYQIRRALSPQGPFSVIQGGWNGTSFTDPNPFKGITAYYTVSAANLAGEGPVSGPVSARLD